jgi:3-phenylpropionate/trans-cinnamate dioxygenase ferredoxin subunit
MMAKATRWLKVGDERVTGLAEGQLAGVTVRGQALCFVRMKGTLYALEDRCPHQGRPLSGGWCDEGHVVCPFHRFHFEPATGKARHNVCANAVAHPVQERGDGVYVGFPYTTIRVFGFDLW